MFKKWVISLLLFVFLVSCTTFEKEEEKQNKNFSKEIDTSIKRKSRVVSNEELQEGAIPLYEWIFLEGQIIQTDQKNNEITKGTRFILQNEDYQYQVINEQTTSNLNLGDFVCVYGEYYGFIKASLIERCGENDQ